MKFRSKALISLFLPFSGLSAVSLADLNKSNEDKWDNHSKKGTLSRLKKAVSLGSLSGSVGAEKKPKKVGADDTPKST